MHLRKSTSRNAAAHFNKQEFNNIVNKYENSNLTYRIDNVIIRNAKKIGQKYTFYLDWPDGIKENHLLKVTFSRNDIFHNKYSWIIKKEALLKEFYKDETVSLKPRQRYYSLSIKEIVNPSKIVEKSEIHKNQETEILSMWLAVDGLVGELRNIKKGKHVSGNDVLAIYSYFDRLFKIKNTFICDESRLADKKDTVRIPLRLISSLCTGKTWYQNKLSGVKLFECNQFKSAYNGLITQHTNTRDNALKDLQKLYLRDWYNMLDKKSKQTLIKIFHAVNSLVLHPKQSSYFFSNTIDEHHFGNVTLQELAMTLFKDAKEKLIITSHLKNFTRILCGRMHWDHNLIPKQSESDFWVKSRVREILWGGYFWTKQADKEVLDTKKIVHIGR